MSFQLEPPDYQSYLSPGQLLERLRAEFAFVAEDAQAGVNHIAPMLRQFERAGASEAALAWMRQQHRSAVQITVADTAGLGTPRVTFVVTPGRGLWIGFDSDSDEIAAAGLVKRCCRALGYVVCRDGGSEPPPSLLTDPVGPGQHRSS
jgi:hypothetical protein